MDAYIYGERLPLPEGFAAYHDRWRSAVVSIDMHQGHLADTPDCPCPAPRARELVAPIDAFHDQARRLGVPIIPCADHFAQTRRRRRQRSESGVAAGLPTLRG
jgi:biuret amidohydrolase